MGNDEEYNRHQEAMKRINNDSEANRRKYE